MAILNNSNAISTSGGYDINNSLRFRSSATAYLNRTPATASNQKTWTWSAWVKLGAISTNEQLFSAGTNANGVFYDGVAGGFGIDGFYNGTRVQRYTTAVYRDPSAWYHVVAVVDTTQATDTNRLKMYINGVQIALSIAGTGTYPALNSDGVINSVVVHAIGRRQNVPDLYYDGYMADINFIDGSAKTPSDFGETDTDTGSWKPKAYTGTYGTNGFYLKFSDIATTSGSNAGLGKDFSGNTNYWTTNNISVTAGTTYDAMKDSPTNTSATVANYCTLNPVDKLNWLSQNAAMTFTNGNLTFSSGSAGNMTQGTIAVNSGKWYYELTFASANTFVGIRATRAIPTGDLTYRYYNNTGAIDTCAFNSASPSLVTTVASSTSGDVMGVAFDLDNNTISWYKNNTLLYTLTGVVADTYAPATGGASTATASINFGQRPFVYTPPTGFVALNTYNLPTPTILQGNKYMDAVLWTGNDANPRSITGLNFSPDFVWVKSRSNAQSHVLNDIVRGSGTSKALASQLTDAEGSANMGLYGAVTAFNSDGFSVGGGTTNQAFVNFLNYTYVGWAWDAGSSTSSNTSGSITSTVSVNTTAGFSIVTYTGTGANATVGHGLGVAPKMIIVKRRSTGTGTYSWTVWNKSVADNSGAAFVLFLEATSAATSRATSFNSTAPTSTVFSIGTDLGTNENTSNFVAYCWAEIAGFSRFGSYTGNGSADGPFVYLGFRPKFIMVKSSSAVGNWFVLDSMRDTSNVATRRLFPNLSNAEDTSALVDFTANGFKLRMSSALNDASTYIYMAFAESPFKNSLAR
jgi:hypothetical protein